MAALPVQARSAVGAGDSFLAGLVLGLSCGLGPHDALALATATGGAAVSHYGTALATHDDAVRFFRQLAGDAAVAQVFGARR